MSLKDWTPKVAALVAIGFAIWILFVECITLFWRHQVHAATWRLALGVLLTLIFFRNRKFAFATTVLSISLVFAGLEVPFRPTVPGIVMTVVSAVLLYALAVYESRRFPYLKRKDWKIFFDKDPE
jgi:hypothetical protein